MVFSLLLVEVINPFISTHGMAAVFGTPFLYRSCAAFSFRAIRPFATQV